MADFEHTRTVRGEESEHVAFWHEVYFLWVQPELFVEELLGHTTLLQQLIQSAARLDAIQRLDVTCRVQNEEPVWFQDPYKILNIRCGYGS